MTRRPNEHDRGGGKLCRNEQKVRLGFYCTQIRPSEHDCRSNVCKDHRDKTEVPDPLNVEDLISYKLHNRRKLARLITQYRDIYCVISLANFRLL